MDLGKDSNKIANGVKKMNKDGNKVAGGVKNENSDNVKDLDENKFSKSKREIIAETIEAGGATMESLMKAAGCKYASVMSCFTMLRLTGRCPVKDVETIVIKDGKEVTETTYRLVDSKEWEEIKAARTARAAKTARSPLKTPEQQLEIFKAQFERLVKTFRIAKIRAEAKKDSEILKLKVEKARIMLEIVKLEIAELESVKKENKTLKTDPA